MCKLKLVPAQLAFNTISAIKTMNLPISYTVFGRQIFYLFLVSFLEFCVWISLWYLEAFYRLNVIITRFIVLSWSSLQPYGMLEWWNTFNSLTVEIKYFASRIFCKLSELARFLNSLVVKVKIYVMQMCQISVCNFNRLTDFYWIVSLSTWR